MFFAYRRKFPTLVKKIDNETIKRIIQPGVDYTIKFSKNKPVTKRGDY